jgi:hypothetical protein
MTSLDSYITLRRSGLRLSPLSLGTMTFGEDNGWGASPATSEANMAEYLDRGGNVIDTANTYTNGHSENIVGDFLAARPGLRDRVLLGTKFFANLHPGDPNGGGAGCGFRRNGAPRPEVLEQAARPSSVSSRNRCGDCRPTTSTSTGCTAGTAAPRDTSATGPSPPPTRWIGGAFVRPPATARATVS